MTKLIWKIHHCISIVKKSGRGSTGTFWMKPVMKAIRCLNGVKFLAIYANNLDEYFMVRVSGIQRQLVKGVLKSPPDGMTPQQQSKQSGRCFFPIFQFLYDTWHKDILPKLASEGIFIHTYADLTDLQKELMRRYFIDEIFPVLTPLVFDSAHPFPFISNRSLNLAIIVRNQNNKDFFARVKVPTNLFSRLIRIPPKSTGESGTWSGCTFRVY